MFETSFSHSSESEITGSYSPETIIALMHQFELIIRLNPDCKGYELINQISETSWEYRVEDYLAFIPKRLWNGGVFYTAIYTLTDDGCDITVRAPGGFTSINQWRLIPVSTDKRVVRITSDAKCNRTFATFVKKFLENSHGTQQRAFQERVAQTARPAICELSSGHDMITSPHYDMMATAREVPPV